MNNCCQTLTTESTNGASCPICQQKGKRVQLITLKSLLTPESLETIRPDSTYYFCTNPSCDMVYYNDSQSFRKENLKVLVYPKDESWDVPVCYCFNWTKERLKQAIQENQDPINHIRKHVQANRCGC